MLHRHPPIPGEPNPSSELRKAKWVMGVLTLLIDVVGKESVLSVVLDQARCEIESLVQSAPAAADDSDRMVA